MWQVESAAYELHSMCLEAVAEVVESDALLLRFGVPEPLWEAVRIAHLLARAAAGPGGALRPAVGRRGRAEARGV